MLNLLALRSFSVGGVFGTSLLIFYPIGMVGFEPTISGPPVLRPRPTGPHPEIDTLNPH